MSKLPIIHNLKILTVFIIFQFNYSQKQLTDLDFYKAYNDLEIIEYAKNAFDLDNKICSFLTSQESFDKKMAIVDAFNSASEMEAGDLFFKFLCHKHGISKIEEIQNIEDKLILSYLYFTSDLDLSKKILSENNSFISERLSFAILKFLIDSQEKIKNNECQVWVDFQKLDSKIYKTRDFKENALTIIAKSIDDLKNSCSKEILVITKTKRNFKKENLINRFKLKNENGIYKINLNLNNSVELDFILDSGASVVLIPEDVFRVLIRNGTIMEKDIIGFKNFTIADGTTSKRPIFRIKSLAIGKIIVNDVEAAVGELNSDLLLGQSFIKKFKSIKIDNIAKELIIENY